MGSTLRAAAGLCPLWARLALAYSAKKTAPVLAIHLTRALAGNNGAGRCLYDRIRVKSRARFFRAHFTRHGYGAFVLLKA